MSNDRSGASAPSTGRTALIVVAWSWVAIPFLYGVWSLLQNVGALFS